MSLQVRTAFLSVSLLIDDGAGIDLAYNFLKHLVGEEFADSMKNITEFSTKESSSDDEFAAHFGLA